MLKNLTNVTVAILGAVATSAATLPTPAFAINSVSEESKIQETATNEVAPEKPKIKRFICKGCNTNESLTLEFLQNNGITDKNALATIMGNIRQESTFVPNICEGGIRTSYRGCTRGGYGLIQFTSQSRYNGLGNFAARYGGDPSSLDTQLRYIINESQWKNIEDELKVPGKSIDHYMRLTYSWLGWGHHGARTQFAYSYANRLVLS